MRRRHREACLRHERETKMTPSTNKSDNGEDLSQWNACCAREASFLTRAMCNASTWTETEDNCLESLEGENELLAFPYHDDEQEGEEDESSSDSCKQLTILYLVPAFLYTLISVVGSTSWCHVSMGGTKERSSKCWSRQIRSLHGAQPIPPPKRITAPQEGIFLQELMQTWLRFLEPEG